MRKTSRAALILLLISALLPRMCVPMPVPAQTDSQMRAIMALEGASSEEDLDEQEVEAYLHLLSHPLEINLAGKSRLVSSGLLSRYQAASVEDYRSRHGDILSAAELSFVEGFDSDFAEALRPFLSFRSAALPGAIPDDTLRLRQETLGRAAFRDGEYNYGLKYRASLGGMLEASLAGRTVYADNSAFPPSSWSFSAAFRGRRLPVQAIVGDYNLRFGQGLALWSGLSMSGFSSSSSFSKRPSGLSPSYSWTGSGTHRGLAADYQRGHFGFVTFLSFPGLRERWQGNGKSKPIFMPGLNLGWQWRSGQASVTAYSFKDQDAIGLGGKLAADFRLNRRGVDLFGESAVCLGNGAFGTLIGSSARLGDDWRVSAVARYYQSSFSSEYSGAVRGWTKPSDERGVAFGLERYASLLACDFAAKDSDPRKRQWKLLFKSPLQMGRSMVLTLRFTERIRAYEPYIKYRTGARADLDWSSAGISARWGESDNDTWKGRIRLEGLLCRSLAGLSYIECGRKTSSFSAYLRGTVFFVDNWDDRIYSYERDAPGNFTVPAYYGRGYSISALGGGKFSLGRRAVLKVWLRASTLRYPFMKNPRPDKAEVKLQSLLSL